MAYRIAYFPVTKNCFSFEVGFLIIYFSFLAPVAFRWKGKNTRIISENIWGENTEKHLLLISANQTTQTLKRKEFEKEFKRAYNKNFIMCANELLKERFGIAQTEIIIEERETENGKTK